MCGLAVLSVGLGAFSCVVSQEICQGENRLLIGPLERR